MTLWFRAKFFLVTPIVSFIATMGVSALYIFVLPYNYFTEPFLLLSFILAHAIVVGLLYQKELFSSDTLISDIAEKEDIFYDNGGIYNTLLIRLLFLWAFYFWMTVLIILAFNRLLGYY